MEHSERQKRGKSGGRNGTFAVPSCFCNVTSRILTLFQARLFLSCPQILPENGCDRQAERREGDMTVCIMCARMCV